MTPFLIFAGIRMYNYRFIRCLFQLAGTENATAQTFWFIKHYIFLKKYTANANKNQP